jgi:SET domain-containing protein
MLCELCRSVRQNTRNRKIHERLRQVETTERIARSGKFKPVWITRFLCEICGTKWRHEDDSGNNNIGWSIENPG